MDGRGSQEEEHLDLIMRHHASMGLDRCESEVGVRCPRLIRSEAGGDLAV